MRRGWGDWVSAFLGDYEFLFFLVLTFVFDIISVDVKMVTFLAVGVAGICILPNLGAYYASDNMMFSFGLLLVIFTFILAIYNAATRKN